MDERLQRRIQRYGWDAAAHVYEDAWRAQLAPAHDALMELAAIGPGAKVLELACGTGLITLRAAAAAQPGGWVLATDISAEMVGQTASRAKAAGLGNVETARMDAEQLEVDESSFDGALCALGLMYVPNPVKALAQLRRAVRPGGRIAVAVWGERRNCGWAEIFPIVDARVNSEVCPLFYRLGGKGVLAAEMQAAGLSAIAEKRITCPLVFDDEPALIAAQIDGGAVALAAKRFSPETRREVEEEFLASVAAYRRADGSYAVPGEFVVAAGSA